MNKIILLILGLVMVASVAAWSAPKQESNEHYLYGVKVLNNVIYENDDVSIKLTWKHERDQEKERGYTLDAVVTVGETKRTCDYHIEPTNHSDGITKWTSDDAKHGGWFSCGIVRRYGAHLVHHMLDWRVKEENMIEYTPLPKLPLVEAHATE